MQLVAVLASTYCYMASSSEIVTRNSACDQRPGRGAMIVIHKDWWPLFLAQIMHPYLPIAASLSDQNI